MSTYDIQYIAIEDDPDLKRDVVQLRITEAAVIDTLDALTVAMASVAEPELKARLGIIAAEIETCYRKAKLVDANSAAEMAGIHEDGPRNAFTRGYLMAKGLR